MLMFLLSKLKLIYLPMCKSFLVFINNFFAHLIYLVLYFLYLQWPFFFSFYVYLCIYMYIYWCIYIYACCACIYIYQYIHIYIYIYVYIYIYISFVNSLLTVKWLKKLIYLAVEATLPNTSDICSFWYFHVIYTLMNPIRSKMFNFSIFFNNLDIKVFLDDNPTLSCDGDFRFVDKFHNHIITGNL